MIELVDTNAAEIAAEFVASRARAGSPAMGMVMTMVIVVDEDGAKTAMSAARKASHEHPARVLGVIMGDGRGKPRVHAQVGTGDAGWTGETALIRLSGPVVKHPESVVLPLLLPDSPVVVWWAGEHPQDPASDPLGALATRRVTDAASSTGRGTAIRRLCASYAPGSTDLAWTRLTPWRALLAAALDQSTAKPKAGRVTAEKSNPSADLLVAWLEWRLRVPVKRAYSDGPGLTDVELDTASGPIAITRADGKLATFTIPGRPDRPVALKRRELPELLTEELRRLDEDDIFAAVAQRLVKAGKK